MRQQGVIPLQEKLVRNFASGFAIHYTWICQQMWWLRTSSRKSRSFDLESSRISSIAFPLRIGSRTGRRFRVGHAPADGHNGTTDERPSDI